MFSSRTGRVVPTIFGSMDLSLMSVVRVDRAVAARGVRRRIPRAIVADSNDQHLGAHRLETVSLLKVVLVIGDELLLDVLDAAADLAYRVMMVTARQLVVRRALPEVSGVHRPRSRQRLERAIDRAARKSRPRRVQLLGDLV